MYTIMLGTAQAVQYAYFRGVLISGVSCVLICIFYLYVYVYCTYHGVGRLYK